MANRYLHIGIHWVAEAKTDEIQRLIEFPGAVEDWMKYGGNCWIVYTQHDQSAWADYLKPYLGANSVIIMEIVNLHQSNGWLPGWAWGWFNKLRH